MYQTFEHGSGYKREVTRRGRYIARSDYRAAHPGAAGRGLRGAARDAARESFASRSSS